MSTREVIGVLIVIVGVVVAPFGHWMARIFYLIGFGFVLAGAYLVFFGRRARKREIPEYNDPNCPGVPPVGDAKGFHGAAVRRFDFQELDDLEGD